MNRESEEKFGYDGEPKDAFGNDSDASLVEYMTSISGFSSLDGPLRISSVHPRRQPIKNSDGEWLGCLRRHHHSCQKNSRAGHFIWNRMEYFERYSLLSRSRGLHRMLWEQGEDSEQETAVIVAQGLKDALIEISDKEESRSHIRYLMG